MLGEHVIDLCMCCDNVVLTILCGGGVRFVSAHVSFVGGGGARYMVLDKCWRETRDGGKLLTMGECSKECC